jgi:hypothetical protein
LEQWVRKDVTNKKEGRTWEEIDEESFGKTRVRWGFFTFLAVG